MELARKSKVDLVKILLPVVLTLYCLSTLSAPEESFPIFGADLDPNNNQGLKIVSTPKSLCRGSEHTFESCSNSKGEEACDLEKVRWDKCVATVEEAYVEVNKVCSRKSMEMIQCQKPTSDKLKSLGSKEGCRGSEKVLTDCISSVLNTYKFEDKDKEGGRLPR